MNKNVCASTVSSNVSLSSPAPEFMSRSKETSSGSVVSAVKLLTSKAAPSVIAITSISAKLLMKSAPIVK